MNNETKPAAFSQKWTGPQTEKNENIVDSQIWESPGKITRNFTVVDLWKMEKNLRSATVRKRWIC
jgi:hypothetical protein